MMQLLHTDGAWLAIGISVFSLVVGIAMKRVFVNILKKSAADAEAQSAPPENQKHD